MMRFLFLRVVIPLLVLWLVRGLLKSLFSSFHSSVAQAPKQAPGFQSGGELKKDPVCGTYVSAEASITKNVNGELLHFCSTNCRDKYRGA